MLRRAVNASIFAAALLMNLSGTPISRTESSPNVPYSQVDECSPERMGREKDRFLSEYFISDINGDIILMPRNASDYILKLHVDQIYTDISNTSGATLACYEGHVGYRALVPECARKISACQKAALKAAARMRSDF